jgi:hypothetical protein
LRGLLNAGHKRGACAYRCAGEGMALRAFKAFAPAVLSGIGTLPGTLHDRSIHIPLVKATPGEIATQFDEEQTELETILARKLARWCLDNFAALQSCRPKMPATAHNRLADNWRPLFAIAEVAGGDWPRLVLEAFNKLTAREYRDAQSIGVTLLNDIRQIFARSGRDRFHSKDLVAALCADADSPWPEAHRGQAITENWLCRQLRRFGIDSHNIRIDERQAKGYELSDFAEAFARFGRADGR